MWGKKNPTNVGTRILVMELKCGQLGETITNEMVRCKPGAGKIQFIRYFGNAFHKQEYIKSPVWILPLAIRLLLINGLFLLILGQGLMQIYIFGSTLNN